MERLIIWYHINACLTSRTVTYCTIRHVLSRTVQYVTSCYVLSNISRTVPYCTIRHLLSRTVQYVTYSLHQLFSTCAVNIPIVFPSQSIQIPKQHIHCFVSPVQSVGTIFSLYRPIFLHLCSSKAEDTISDALTAALSSVSPHNVKHGNFELPTKIHFLNDSPSYCRLFYVLFIPNRQLNSELYTSSSPKCHCHLPISSATTTAVTIRKRHQISTPVFLSSVSHSTLSASHFKH
jgi:hypothetical protein